MRCAEVWIPDVFGYPAGAAADLRGGRDAPLRHPEAVVEQAEPVPALDVLVGGHRRHAGAHPLPAGRHLQRRDHRRPRCAYAESATSSEHGWSEWSLMPFGHGDGGGGPTREMLERARRHGRPRRRARRSPSARRTSSSTPSRPRSRAGAPVPVWRGELYFETHRGTLTSQLAHQARQPAVRAAAARGRAVVGDAVGAAPRRDVDDLWREVLTAAVPRHHPRLVDRLGRMPTPRPSSPASPTISKLASASCSPRSHRRAGRSPTRPTCRSTSVVVLDGDPRRRRWQRLADGRLAVAVTVPALGVAPLEAQPIDRPGRRHRLAR